jgi:hypothetical protein
MIPDQAFPFWRGLKSYLAGHLFEAWSGKVLLSGTLKPANLGLKELMG